MGGPVSLYHRDASALFTRKGRANFGGVVTSGPSTRDFYPTLTTHPAAQWTESNGWLTSPSRRRLPVATAPDGFVLGTTVATWDNTAITTTVGTAHDGGNLTTYTGTAANNYELVTTADGQVIQDMYLPNARIRVKHKNVTIDHCWIQVGYYSGRALIQNNCGIVCDTGFDTSGGRVTYTTIDPVNAGGADPLGGGESKLYGYYYNRTAGTWSFSQVPNGTADDAQVSGMFLVGEWFVWRCATQRVTDAIMPDYNNTNTPQGAVHVWSCYLETRWLSWDGEQYRNGASSIATHNDGVQLTHCDGDTIIGNTIVCPPGGIVEPNTGRDTQGQCIVLTPYHGPNVSAKNKNAGQVSNTVIWNNKVSGSYTQIGSWLPLYEGGPGAPGLSIKNNKHGGTCVWPILITPATNNTKRAISGNVADTGGLKWNQPQSTLAAGATVSPQVVSTSTSAPIDVSADTSYAGMDQIVEPGDTAYLLGKGVLNAAPDSWIKTGTWSRVSGPTFTITSGTSSDGHTYASFVAPSSTVAQTAVVRFTPAGTTATDDVTVTIPPNQN